MKIPVGVKVTALILGATLFYTYVGQMVPQKEVYPPVTLELSDDMSVAEMLDTGLSIMEGKGMCLTCHTIGGSGTLRYPDLQGIGSRAGNERPGYSDVDYLVESMLDPEAYIVEGFTGGMPVIDKPPIGLTDQEILTVIAYLQSLGGEVSVDMTTDIRNLGAVAETEGAAANPADGSVSTGGDR